MSTAVSQVERLLNLVPYLLSHPGSTVSEVAEEFGVTAKQVAKDLNVLWFCGLPGGFADDLMEAHVEEGGAIHLENAAEPIVRPLRLSTREAVALLVALRALAQVPGIADRDALDRAVAKLENATGDSARLAERLSVAFEARDVVFEAAQRALAEKRLVHLRYYVPSRDEVTERDVDPMRVALLAGRAYLEGWCRLSKGVRLFRLDRVVGIEVLDLPSEPPADAVGLDLTEQAPATALRVDEDDPLVTLELAPEAHWVPEYYPCESVREVGDGDGRLHVTLRAADPDRIRRLVLRLGGAARVLAPESFVAEVRDTAAEALAAYGADATA
ncbi:MAG TPA: WYL domain-containing protein [Actinocrinis sp.]|uniref:helix-turn-helix transcriptional regulator n=1 Tax=Actinocrinis sp. TaxID=1920516 RepID=UPI002DDCC090|nr:WYL domain-containing protein [Actinocrinis sp.]HEV2347496.1 WYL domain-containing protein [Actinocrinis sp.]